MDESQFRMDLESMLNRHSMEGRSNTPDFILASYMVRCLEAFDIAVNAREKWYGRVAQQASKEIAEQLSKRSAT